MGVERAGCAQKLHKAHVTSTEWEREKQKVIMLGSGQGPDYIEYHKDFGLHSDFRKKLREAFEL